MEILYLIIGILIGAFSTYFLLRTKLKEISKNKEYEVKYRNLELEKIRLETENKNFGSRLNEEIQKNEKIITENKELLSELTKKETDLINLNDKVLQQKKDLEELQKQLKLEFENLANKILEEKSRSFNEVSKNQLDNILRPFNDNLKDLKQTFKETYEKELKERSELGNELKHIQELNQKLQIEANNLVNALKGDSQKQGRWGEMILEKILESSGLIKDEHYSLQESYKIDDGRNLRPDAIVKLPENKHIIIDSKVSLKAYEKYLSAEDEEQRQNAIKEHILSIRTHIKELSEKDYISKIGVENTEYILMFVPIEGSFSLAVNHDKSIFNDAWERCIVIVSPSTLIATLMTISAVWRQNKQTQNANKIADLGGKLYDKFVGFLSDMESLEKSLISAQSNFVSAKRKLSDGNANIIKQAQQLKILGAKTNKSIDKSFIEGNGLNSLEE